MCVRKQLAAAGQLVRGRQWSSLGQVVTKLCARHLQKKWESALQFLTCLVLIISLTCLHPFLISLPRVTAHSHSVYKDTAFSMLVKHYKGGIKQFSHKAVSIPESWSWIYWEDGQFAKLLNWEKNYLKKPDTSASLGGRKTIELISERASFFRLTTQLSLIFLLKNSGEEESLFSSSSSTSFRRRNQQTNNKKRCYSEALVSCSHLCI